MDQAAGLLAAVLGATYDVKAGLLLALMYFCVLPGFWNHDIGKEARQKARERLTNHMKHCERTDGMAGLVTVVVGAGIGMQYAAVLAAFYFCVLPAVWDQEWRDVVVSHSQSPGSRSGGDGGAGAVDGGDGGDEVEGTTFQS